MAQSVETTAKTATTSVLSSSPCSESNTFSSESIAEFIQCPICYDSMLNEIFTCPNGHNVCQQCFYRLGRKICPSCKENYKCCESKTNRNLTLETLIFNTTLPCKYNAHGCNEMIHGEQRKQHMKVCGFRPLQCPFSCAILPLFQECLYSANSMDELLSHCSTQHNFDVFQHQNNVFQFQLDDITDGSGHYRIILKSMQPKLACLLIGFKAQSGSIVLFVRALHHAHTGLDYKIIANFKTKDECTHSMQWASKMYATSDEVGLEHRNGLLLKLSREQVKLWQSASGLAPDVPLTVIVGDAQKTLQ